MQRLQCLRSLFIITQRCVCLLVTWACPGCWRWGEKRQTCVWFWRTHPSVGSWTANQRASVRQDFYRISEWETSPLKLGGQRRPLSEGDSSQTVKTKISTKKLFKNAMHGPCSYMIRALWASSQNPSPQWIMRQYDTKSNQGRVYKTWPLLLKTIKIIKAKRVWETVTVKKSPRRWNAEISCGILDGILEQ